MKSCLSCQMKMSLMHMQTHIWPVFMTKIRHCHWNPLHFWRCGIGHVCSWTHWLGCGMMNSVSAAAVGVVWAHHHSRKQLSTKTMWSRNQMNQTLMPSVSFCHACPLQQSSGGVFFEDTDHCFSCDQTWTHGWTWRLPLLSLSIWMTLWMWFDWS